ncbi:hypothetical protein K443DRAFT_488953 [Laccaria amethystina LaAM-08-1]|uniref:Uncharacterized protein n=1 Tax=Laccaria amethystina LaAM-08-1 TaxID=1095629 RepID=A0A0C9XNV3_9AGAR|nr:hypothetical protein K443DRAFT_488953 [Laccaria amethystina LaAM-08-1]
MAFAYARSKANRHLRGAHAKAGRLLWQGMLSPRRMPSLNVKRCYEEGQSRWCAPIVQESIIRNTSFSTDINLSERNSKNLRWHFFSGSDADLHHLLILPNSHIHAFCQDTNGILQSVVTAQHFKCTGVTCT